MLSYLAKSQGDGPSEDAEAAADGSGHQEEGIELLPCEVLDWVGAILRPPNTRAVTDAVYLWLLAFFCVFFLSALALGMTARLV